MRDHFLLILHILILHILGWHGFYQGEPEESQQGEHYSNQAWREQERKLPVDGKEAEMKIKVQTHSCRKWEGEK